jgi:hypothetical protein
LFSSDASIRSPVLAPERVEGMILPTYRIYLSVAFGNSTSMMSARRNLVSLALIWLGLLFPPFAWAACPQGPSSSGECLTPAAALDAIVPVEQPVLQNAGGWGEGHQLVWADRSTRLTADFLQVWQTNPVLFHINISGAPKVGQSLGVSATIAGVTYTVTYTAQPTDSTLQAVAIGLRNCLENDAVVKPPTGMPPPGAHCSVMPSSLTQALLNLTPRYRTSAGNTELYSAAGGIDLDLPPPPITSSFTGVSTPAMSVEVSPSSIAAAQADNGPNIGTVSLNGWPKRVPISGDRLGYFTHQGVNTEGALVEYGGIGSIVVDPRAGAAQGVVCFKTANGNGNRAGIPALCASKGVFVSDSSGSGTLLSDLGYGSFHAVHIHADDQVTVGDGSASTTLGRGLAIIESSSTDSTGFALINKSKGGAAWNVQTQGSTAPRPGWFDISSKGTGLHIDEGGNTIVDGALTTASLIPSSMRLPQMKVNELPKCERAAQGLLYLVTDAVAPAWNGPINGGGSAVVMALCNGSSWTAH